MGGGGTDKNTTRKIHKGIKNGTLLKGKQIKK